MPSGSVTPAGGATPALAAVLAVGNTTSGRSVIFDGDNEEYPRGPGTEAAQTGGAASSLYFGEPGPGGSYGAAATLSAGFAQVNSRSGGDVRVIGGDGLDGAGASAGGALLVLGGGGSTGTAGRVTMQTNGSIGSGGEVPISNGSELLYGDLGGVKCDTHAAPADGALAAGDLYLWFDQANGAAKLMVKAKTADGTVVTASIALA